ncbi:MAG TPA: hypothetical protein VGD71_40020 [Kribbella sp.]
MIHTDTGTSYAALNVLITRAANPSGSIVTLTDEEAVALYRRWNNELSARLDYALEFQGMRCARETAASAWLQLEHDQPALRLLLDTQADRPATQGLADNEATMMAIAAGLAGLEAPRYRTVTVGRNYLAELRSLSLRGHEHHANTA